MSAGGKLRSPLAGASLGRAHAGLHERLLARAPEIEQAALIRICAISDPTEVEDPAYAEGLRAAVAVAIDYLLAGVRSTGRNPPQVPPALLVQARMAARNGVGLDTVLRRCFTGHALFEDFLIEEAEVEEEGKAALKRLLRVQASYLDRLLAAVSEEHARESEGRLDTADERRAELVGRLLAGERLETSELNYDFEVNHRGAIAKGPGAAEALRELAASLDRRLLLIRAGDGMVWAWLGGRRDVTREGLRRAVSGAFSPQVLVALGEEEKGPAGWRLTHRQARAALPIATCGSERIVHYADVALVASIRRDELLATSLRRIYLQPLESERDGGEMARKTLRAYFSSGRSVSSAAHALGINRNTVTSRLRAIEARIGRRIDSCAPELEMVLRLVELD